MIRSAFRSAFLPILAGGYLCVAAASPGYCAAGSDLPPITVEGNREQLKENMQHFVSRITRPDFLDRSLARWNQPMCPSVRGLARDHAENLLARISTIADAAKVPLGKEDCKPNLSIIFMSDPKETLTRLAKREPFIFGNGGRSNYAAPTSNIAGPSTVAAFINSSTPVRAWYNTTQLSENGGQRFDEGYDYPHKIRDTIGSTHISHDAIESFTTILIVVDTTKVLGHSFITIDDYIAMISLMELQPDAHIGEAPLILSQFQGVDDAPTSLTNWDAAFLAGLYNSAQISRGQRALIVDRMITRIAPQQ